MLIAVFLFTLIHLLTSQLSINSPCHPSHRNIQNDIAIPLRRMRRGATASKVSLWPNGEVPYTISRTFKQDVSLNIRKAMKIWESSSCIRFVKHSNQSYGLKFEPQDCGCCSFVGRQQFGNGKPQEISIKGQDCEDIGHMLHEIGHALGFWHEHVRPDRDNYVQLKSKNIDDDAIHNFDRKNKSEINSLGEKYDYKSIMHYSAYSFGINKYKKTLKTVQRFTPIGQRYDLSTGDITQINKLYRCPKDHNQCLINNGNCQHRCINLYKGHKCQCYRGYKLNRNGLSCTLSCNDYFRHPEGLIYSPNYPDKYDPNLSCMWTIHAPPGDHIQITLLKLDMESSSFCVFDVLKIEIPYNNVWYPYAVYCDKLRQRKKNLIKSNIVRIQFKSDNSVQKSGFKLYYKFVPSECLRNYEKCHHLGPPVPVQWDVSRNLCDREYYTSRGSLYVPEVRPAKCIAKIKLLSASVVRITFATVNLTLTPACTSEYVVVSKGQALTPQLRLCGYHGNRQTYDIRSRFLWISYNINYKDSKLVILYSTVHQ